jgi:hypothetical protein
MQRGAFPQEHKDLFRIGSIAIIGVRVSIDDRANVLGERGPLFLFAARLRGVAQSGRSASFTMGQPISVRQALSSGVSGGPTK